ncbi:hypothetical protein H8E50_07285 [bacterium]|nr:hypothetical protein [bacterium]
MFDIKAPYNSESSSNIVRSEKMFNPKDDHYIACGNCHNPITLPQYIVTINNHHIYTVTNPYDITFDIGCFSAAKGCTLHGEPTDEDTWFPGFQWIYTACSNCSHHLGWYYQNGEEEFYGLINDLLSDKA